MVTKVKNWNKIIKKHIIEAERQKGITITKKQKKNNFRDRNAARNAKSNTKITSILVQRNSLGNLLCRVTTSELVAIKLIWHQDL